MSDWVHRGGDADGGWLELTPELAALCARLEGPAGAGLREALALARATSDRFGAKRDDERDDDGTGDLSSVPSAQGLAAVEQLLAQDPRFGSEEPATLAWNLFSDEDRERLDELRKDFADVLAIGLPAVVTGGPDDDLVGAKLAALLRCGIGADPASTILRNALLGRRPLLPPRPDIEDLMDRVQEYIDSTCWRGIVGALLEWSAAAREARFVTHTRGITGLAPTTGCPGDVIAIEGSGFGSKQPERTFVLVPRRGGGCLYASVVSWSDERVEVMLPAEVGRGAVGFVIPPENVLGSTAVEASQVAGELESCLGPAAAHQADKIRHGLGGQRMECPKRLPGDVNYLDAGLPFIEWFAVNGSATDARVAPGGTVHVSWRVDRCTNVEIELVGSGHELPTPPTGLHPTGGSFSSPPVPGDSDWSATYVLRAFNDCTGPANPVTAQVVVQLRRTVGIVLAGGGAKGDFEVGALRYLYGVGIRPDIVVGTSVGAINGVKLAEGDGNTGTAQEQLEAIWRSLVANSDMYLPMDWLKDLEQLIKRRADLGIGSLMRSAAAWTAFPGLLLFDLVATTIDAKEIVGIIERMRLARSLYNLAPMQVRLADPAQLSPTRVAASGIRLRLVSVGLESGAIRWVDENGMSDRGSNPGVVTGALASAALPLAFPPVILDGETCVDGGVREVLPLRMAVEEGANVVYAILAGAPVPPYPSLRTANLVPLARRSIGEVMVDELTIDDIGRTPWGVPVHVIRPGVDVHDTLTIDPGLIDINIDYGWMVAADVVELSAADRFQAASHADEIASARMESWRLEHHLHAERLPTDHSGTAVRPVPDTALVGEIRGLKHKIRRHAQGRALMGARLESGVERWWQAWEIHPWTPRTNDPWVEFKAGSPSVPAEPMPPPL